MYFVHLFSEINKVIIIIIIILATETHRTCQGLSISINRFALHTSSIKTIMPLHLTYDEYVSSVV